jgi:hypothetical protein
MRKLARRCVLLIVFLLALQLLAGATTALADPGYHVVRPGETLFSIGRLYGVNPYTIASMNGLPNPDYIQIGQVLYVPGAYTPPTWEGHYCYHPYYGWYWCYGSGWGWGWGWNYPYYPWWGPYR